MPGDVCEHYNICRYIHVKKQKLCSIYFEVGAIGTNILVTIGFGTKWSKCQLDIIDKSDINRNKY